MRRLPIQNHLKPSITAKRRSKAKYLTWNSLRRKFVKKTIMPNLGKSLGYVKCYSSSSWRPVKIPSNLSDTTVRKSAVDWENLKPYWKSEKGHISLDDQQSYFKFFKDFTNHRKKTNRVVVLSSRPFPNILKDRDHQRNLPTIWKTRLLETLIEEFS